MTAIAPRRASIHITQRGDGEWDLDINNISSAYLPELLAMIVKNAFEDKLLTPMNDETTQTICEDFVQTVAAILNVKHKWNDLKVTQPADNETGPFLALEKDYPDKIYSNMYWDKNAKIFGTKEGNGYAFLTHWIKAPEL